MLLACVVLIDLASYITVALGFSDVKWMSPLSRENFAPLDGAVAGYTLAVQILFNGLKAEQELLERESSWSQTSSFGST